MFAAWSLVSALALPTPSSGDTHHCECESLAAHATVLWPHGPLVPRPTRTTALTTNDVLSHYDYNASLTSFMHIVRNLMVGASFHSHVHIIRPLLALMCSRSKSCVYAEIGSFCGASMALALSYPGLDLGISISLDSKMYGWHMASVLTQNICCLNAHNVTVHQFSKPSQRAVPDVRRALGGNQIDVLFIDGDHSKNGVMRDYSMYEPLVRPGGAIIFDVRRCLEPAGNSQRLIRRPCPWQDYNDARWSPGVKVAVNRIANKACVHASSTCLGVIPNRAGAGCARFDPKLPPCEEAPTLQSNEFILQK